MTMMQEATARPRELISADLFGRLVVRVMEDEHADRPHAERVVEQALVFLTACARSRESTLTPTKAIDAGWPAFILHTEEYSEFCHRTAGRFIHHRPLANEAEPGAGLSHTLRAVRETGYAVDEDLWRVGAANCHQCHAGCHDSP